MPWRQVNSKTVLICFYCETLFIKPEANPSSTGLFDETSVACTWDWMTCWSVSQAPPQSYFNVGENKGSDSREGTFFTPQHWNKKRKLLVSMVAPDMVELVTLEHETGRHSAVHHATQTIMGCVPLIYSDIHLSWKKRKYTIIQQQCNSKLLNVLYQV